MGRLVQKLELKRWLATGLVSALGGGMALAATGSGFGAGWVADTSVPSTLQSVSLPLGPEVSEVVPGRLRYQVGFGTFEVSSTGFLYDSLTISLARADGSGSVILVTADVFGLTVAPLQPGGLLSGGGISVSEITAGLPELTGLPTAFAYNVDVELPPALRDIPLLTTFDFFNNGDFALSRGFAMVVPEPSEWALLVTGLAVLAGAGKWRRGVRP